MLGREVVVVAAVRTPVGRGSKAKGWYAGIHPNVLLGKVYTELLERAGVAAELVEDAVVGCVGQVGAQSAVGRNAWLQAGLPVETGATAIERKCGSGQQAINFAAAAVASGQAEVVIAAGVEHMGQIGLGAMVEFPERFGTPHPPELLERYALTSQGIAAERIAEKWEISRAELDEIGLRSHRNAARATDEGRFEREILPFEAAGELRSSDQGIRRETSLEALAALKPAFLEGGKVTAGNSSQVSDGAAAVLLMSRQKAEELGLRPRALIADGLALGVDPILMLTGPIPATRKILERNELAISDLDLIEVNEAFASVIGAWRRELAPDMDRVNVNGGAIAIGHPLGASGVRLFVTLLHELERRDGELGLVTMCTGGGQGTATLVKRV